MANRTPTTTFIYKGVIYREGVEVNLPEVSLDYLEQKGYLSPENSAPQTEIQDATNSQTGEANLSEEDTSLPENLAGNEILDEGGNELELGTEGEESETEADLSEGGEEAPGKPIRAKRSSKQG